MLVPCKREREKGNSIFRVGARQDAMLFSAPQSLSKKSRMREKLEARVDKKFKTKRTPCSAVHWTLLFRCSRSYPFKQTMHMKYMSAFSPNWQKRVSIISFACNCLKWILNVLNGQSSPGILQDGQHPSNGTRQIPQTSPSLSSSCSGLPVSQRH